MKYKFSSNHWILCNFEVDLSESEVDAILHSLMAANMNKSLARELLSSTLKSKLTRANRKAVHQQLLNEPLRNNLKCKFNIKNELDLQAKLPEIEELVMSNDREINFPLELNTQAWFLYLNDHKFCPKDEGDVLGQYMAISNVTFGDNCLSAIYMSQTYYEKPYFQKMFYFDGFKYQNMVREVIGERKLFEGGGGTTVYSSEIGYFYGLFILLYDQLHNDIVEFLSDRNDNSVTLSSIPNEDILWIDDQRERDIRRLQRIATSLGIDYSPSHLVEEIQEDIHRTTPEIYTMYPPQILERHM